MVNTGFPLSLSKWWISPSQTLRRSSSADTSQLLALNLGSAIMSPIPLPFPLNKC